jgi:hypothetical protein
MIQTFIRPKYATNTSTYATQYPTIEAAEYEAHFHVQQMLQANGRLTFICADYLKVED